MVPTSYTAKLSHPKWQKKRLEILERDNWTCRLCGDKETTLHVHHKRYGKSNPWESPDEELITYCEPCHFLFEKITESKMELIKVVKHINKAGEHLIYALVNDEEQMGRFITMNIYSQSEKNIRTDLYIFPMEFDIILDLINLCKNG